MRRIFYFIIKRWAIFIVLFTISSIPILYAINQKKLFYQAGAKIAFVGEGELFNPAIEAQKIKERDFLERIAEEVSGLDLLILHDNLNLEFKDKNVLSVSFISADPRLARDTVNVTAILFLKERVGIIEALAREKRARLNAFSSEISRLRNNLNLSKKKARGLKEKNIESDTERLNLQRRIAVLELQRGELLKIFTEKHPEVVNITERIETVRSRLDELPDNSAAYQRLADEIEEQGLTLSLKEKEYENLNASFEDSGQGWRAELVEEAKLSSRPLGRDKGWYYTWGLLAVFAFSLLGSLIVDTIDRRIYIKEEIGHRLKLPVVAEMDKVAFINLRRKLIGLDYRKKALLNYMSNPKLLRRYEHLYTFLKLEVFKGAIEKKVILITSAGPRTGKTFLACNLALAAAKSGEKVLLIDANFRYPAVNLFFGFEDEGKGLSDLLRGSLNHKEVVKNLTDLLLTGSLRLDEKELGGFDNLKILLSGTTVENPLGLLEAKELSDLFNRLSQNYGLLIIDTVSLKAFVDTFNIINSVDSILLVARRAKTTYPSLNNAVSQINKINGPLTGVVLNYV